ncbi:MAG: chromosome segregation protein SMC [Candidatus Diapherotrites archaeon]|nr:chromosome segregation protein SMC [Candidatus Diapherotrites archaeon]
MGKIEKIKMRDFKSFRTAVIPFIEGFTTIVGPNGSGKSNFLDSLIFVLGTGSMKTLRAGRLTDLVHHTSTKNTAEVTIELRDNEEKYAVTREIDKNGASVFRLNDKKTTRNAVVELLTSFHIPPEGYNYIMQGDVTNIINATPKQRREVIDDVSGIAEYNDKKEKALRELDEVNKKLNEANIILYERKGYLGQIKKERDEALRYQRFEKNRDELKKAIIYNEVKDIEAQFKIITDEVIASQKEVEEHASELSTLNQKINSLQERLQALNREIASRGEKEQISVSKEIEQIKSAIQLLNEKKKNKAAYLKSLEEKVKANAEELEDIAKQNKEKNDSLKKLEAERAAYDERLSEKEQELKEYMDEIKEKNLLVGDVTARLEEMNQKIAQEKEEFYKLQSELNSFREKISMLKLSITDEKVEDGEKAKRVQQLRETYDSLNREFAKHKREIRGFDLDLEKLFEEEKNLNKDMEKNESELDKAKEDYHRLQSKASTIKYMTGSTVSDAVMKAKQANELKGIIGKVEDLCKYDAEYANAIQTAAGNRMQFIMTEDADAATRAIKWLKEKKLGRTTFIPLDRMRSEGISPESQKALKHPKAVDLAIKLVSFDSKLMPAFMYVLGDTVIVEDIDAAKDVGFGTCRMATMDGDLAEASGAVTGGYKHGMLTLQDMKSIDDLKKRIETLEKRKAKLLSELQANRDRGNAMRGNKAQYELKIKEEEVRVKELEERLGEYDALTEKSQSKRDSVEAGIAELKQKLVEGEAVLKAKQETTHELEEKKKFIMEKMDSPEIKIVSQRINDMQHSVQTLRDQKAEVVIQMNSLHSELSKVLQEKKKKLDQETSEASPKMNELREDVTRIDGELEDKKILLEEKVEEEKRVSGAIRGLVEERERIELELRGLAEKRGAAERKHEVKAQLLNEQNIKKARLETKYQDLKSEWTYCDEKPQDFGMSIEEMKQEAENLTAKMIRLEPINLKAVEKYDAYMAEVDQMKEKAKKLEDEKAAVIELMKNIEARRTEVFIDAFEAIRKHFNEVYKQFYPESENTYADLKLENAEDPFTGGLVIEAQPAGKPIKRIEAMSGGEKTLAAIAFLFAIQAYAPSPFYILDEADAALDKPNSQRFAKMVQERSKQCQFIVITHNASVIQASDQIVGVSMNKEKGSSVVEVDLKGLDARIQELIKPQKQLETAIEIGMPTA